MPAIHLNKPFSAMDYVLSLYKLSTRHIATLKITQCARKSSDLSCNTSYHSKPRLKLCPASVTTLNFFSNRKEGGEETDEGRGGEGVRDGKPIYRFCCPRND